MRHLFRDKSSFFGCWQNKEKWSKPGTTAVVWELFGNLKKIVQPFTSEKICVTFGNFGIELSLEVVGWGVPAPATLDI